MQKSRKKFWIVFSVVCASVIAFVSVFALATRLKSISVNFTTRLAQNETVLNEGILDKVKNDGNFNYGKTVLFMDFKESVNRIESLNPFVKVEDVETIFPNKAKVKISERTPMYRVQDSRDEDVWHILDIDFKILATISGDIKTAVYSNTTFYAKTYELSSNLITTNLTDGKFVTDKQDLKNLVKTISYAVEDIYQSVSIVSSFFITEESDKIIYNLTMKNAGLNNDNGCEIQIVGSDDIYNKVRAGISCYKTNADISSDDDLSTKVITIEKQNGSFVGIMHNK